MEASVIIIEYAGPYSGDVAHWWRLNTGSPETFARGAGELPRLVALWDG